MARQDMLLEKNIEVNVRTYQKVNVIVTDRAAAISLRIILVLQDAIAIAPPLRILVILPASNLNRIGLIDDCRGLLDARGPLISAYGLFITAA